MQFHRDTLRIAMCPLSLRSRGQLIAICSSVHDEVLDSKHSRISGHIKEECWNTCLHGATFSIDLSANTVSLDTYVLIFMCTKNSTYLPNYATSSVQNPFAIAGICLFVYRFRCKLVTGLTVYLRIQSKDI